MATRAAKRGEVTVLIVEDDDGHATLVEEHLREAGVTNPIMRFRDGREAWTFLNSAGKPDNRRDGTFYLMLLDIRMPHMDGVELLTLIKESAELKEMPVIMLTTTDDPREVDACYKLGCNTYIAKPLDFSKFSETLRRLGLFIQIVRFPGLNGNGINGSGGTITVKHG